jgi:hypothetical protein
LVAGLWAEAGGAVIADANKTITSKNRQIISVIDFWKV